MDFAAVMLVIGALSLTVTKVVDTIRNAVDRNDTLPKVTWNIAAFVVGFLFCLGWQREFVTDLMRLVPALAGDADSVSGVSGYILSGLILGGLAGFGHELMDRLSPKVGAEG